VYKKIRTFTEATVDLRPIAGLENGGCMVEIMNDDSEQCKIATAHKDVRKFNLKIVSIVIVLHSESK
jgi:3,4-dihydroxy-2-butanone 4-phosphate synthase